MKKLFTSKTTIASLIVFGIVLCLSQTTLGQEITTNAGTLSGLISSQNRIASALEKLIEDKNAQNSLETVDTQTMAATVGNPEFDECRALFLTVTPSSSIYKPMTGWDVSMFKMTATDSNATWTREYFNDINGDGLSDYIYLSTTSQMHHSCVYINNGTTMEKENICLATYNTGTLTWSYKGDCADYSS
jgi:hypothetical protein